MVETPHPSHFLLNDRRINGEVNAEGDISSSMNLNPEENARSCYQPTQPTEGSNACHRVMGALRGDTASVATSATTSVSSNSSIAWDNSVVNLLGSSHHSSSNNNNNPKTIPEEGKKALPSGVLALSGTNPTKGKIPVAHDSKRENPALDNLCGPDHQNTVIDKINKTADMVADDSSEFMKAPPELAALVEDTLTGLEADAQKVEETATLLFKVGELSQERHASTTTLPSATAASFDKGESETLERKPCVLQSIEERQSSAPARLPSPNPSFDEDDRKPAAKPTPVMTASTTISVINRPKVVTNADRNISAPTPRCNPGGAHGLGGRRRQSGEAEREARRQQIRGRAGNAVAAAANNPSAVASPRGTRPLTSTLTSPRSISPKPYASLPPEPGTITRALPGDELASSAVSTATIPGDSLASPAAAAAPIRSRARPAAPLMAKAQNPSAEAYGAAAQSSQDMLDYSMKQRMRRQPDADNPLPASTIRPGAYKEIPGRGLERNHTLRFNIMNKMQKPARSLRRMFSSSRRNNFARSSRSSAQVMRSSSTSNISPAAAGCIGRESNGARSRRELMSAHQSFRRNSQSGRSVATIHSVLVEDDEDDSNRYYGNISVRAIADARKNGGLSVARPVYQREPSTLEALCIIPGDLAVAVALDAQIRQDSLTRLEALVSCRELCDPDVPKKSAGKRKSRFVPKAKSIAKLLNPKMIPKNLQKSLNPKRIFRRGKRPNRHKSSNLTKAMGLGSPPKLETIPSLGTMRRHSF